MRMRRICPLLLLLLFLIPTTAVRADSPTHIVAYGETLYSIARQYGISPQALASANGMTTSDWVYAGQRLTIPGTTNDTGAAVSAPVSVAQKSPSGIYLVRAGDTLYSLSRKFGVSVDALAGANDLPPNGFLYTGYQLKIPGLSKPQPIASSASVPNSPAKSNQPPNRRNIVTTNYIVQPGDTLFGIAIKHDVTIQAISIANNLSTQFVYAGQRLSIPNTASASTQTSSTTNNAPAKNAASPQVLARVENIPVYRQQQNLTCEESAASMAVRGALTESQIVAAMEYSDNPFEGIRGNTSFELLGGLTHYGTYAQGLKKGLAKLGRHSTAYYGQPYEKFKASILESLKQGRPVIWWTTWHETHAVPQLVRVSNGTQVPLTPYEHTVLIVAATAEGITYHDPYDGTVRSTSWASHKRTSGYFNNMALVVF